MMFRRGQHVRILSVIDDDARSIPGGLYVMFELVKDAFPLLEEIKLQLWGKRRYHPVKLVDTIRKVSIRLIDSIDTRVSPLPFTISPTSALNSLSLKGVNFNSVHLDFIFPIPTLELLAIKDSTISPFICAHESPSSLKRLEISACKITTSTLSDLLHLFSPNLEELKFRESEAGSLMKMVLMEERVVLRLEKLKILKVEAHLPLECVKRHFEHSPIEDLTLGEEVVPLADLKSYLASQATTNIENVDFGENKTAGTERNGRVGCHKECNAEYTTACPGCARDSDVYNEYRRSSQWFGCSRISSSKDRRTLEEWYRGVLENRKRKRKREKVGKQRLDSRLWSGWQWELGCYLSPKPQ